jgi:hypothetical protein
MMEQVSGVIPKLSIAALDAIDRFLEEYYESGETKEAGKKMAKSGMKKTQVRGLENLIVSTPRFSEIINYIKNQVGKGRDEWQSAGPVLIRQLDHIERKAGDIAGNDPAGRMAVKLCLAKGWARQVVAHYLYEQNMKEAQP